VRRFVVPRWEDWRRFGELLSGTEMGKRERRNFGRRQRDRVLLKGVIRGAGGEMEAVLFDDPFESDKSGGVRI